MSASKRVADRRSAIEIETTERQVNVEGTYESPVSKQVRELKKTVKKKIKQIFHAGTLVSLPLLFSMTVIGLVYFGSCPAQNFLPIYLIVFGLFSMVFTFLRLCGNCCRDDDDQRPFAVEAMIGVMSFFLLAWYISGNWWIYSMYTSYSTDINDSNYCNNTLYLFAFWLTTVVNGLFVLVIFFALNVFWVWFLVINVLYLHRIKNLDKQNFLSVSREC